MAAFFLSAKRSTWRADIEIYAATTEYYAMRRLALYYGNDDFTSARQRMARLQVGGQLIDKPVSVAPGFIVENVHVLPSVQKNMQTMFDRLLVNLKGGA